MATLLEEPRWLTVKQAARRLGLHEITVRRKIRCGELPALQLGGRGTALRILEDELHRFIYGSPPSEVEPVERRDPSGAVDSRAHGGEAV